MEHQMVLQSIHIITKNSWKRTGKLLKTATLNVSTSLTFATSGAEEHWINLKISKWWGTSRSTYLSLFWWSMVLRLGYQSNKVSDSFRQTLGYQFPVVEFPVMFFLVFLKSQQMSVQYAQPIWHTGLTIVRLIWKKIQLVDMENGTMEIIRFNHQNVSKRKFQYSCIHMTCNLFWYFIFPPSDEGQSYEGQS